MSNSLSSSTQAAPPTVHSQREAVLFDLFNNASASQPFDNRASQPSGSAGGPMTMNRGNETLSRLWPSDESISSDRLMSWEPTRTRTDWPRTIAL